MYDISCQLGLTRFSVFRLFAFLSDVSMEAPPSIAMCLISHIFSPCRDPFSHSLGTMQEPTLGAVGLQKTESH